MNVVKAHDSEEFRRLDLVSFLSGEGIGVTISSIVSLARTSGDVVLGIGDRAPTLTNGGTAVDYWLEGGTVNTTSVFDLLLRLSNTEEFSAEIRVNVTSSTW
jgi:hypothetical protein